LWYIGVDVKVTITTNVSHRVNRAYPCVLVQFEPSDDHYFPNSHNWMPKHEEIIEIIDAMIKADPDFYIRLFGGSLADFLPDKLQGDGNLATNLHPKRGR